MKKSFNLPVLIGIASLITIGIVSIAWQKKEPVKEKKPGYSNYEDTTKRKKYLTNKDMEEVDKAMGNLNINLDDLDVQMKNINMDSINIQIKKAMAQVDMQKINADVQVALKNAEEQMKKVDWDKMKVDVDKAMVEAKQAIAQIDTKAIQAQVQAALKNVQDIELKNNINMQDISVQVKKGMEQAKVGIEKAKAHVKELKTFVSELEKDGLIDTKKEYKIEWKGDDLYLNDNKQPKEVSKKYGKYKNLLDSIHMNGDGEEF
ncbi:hypothetical protein QTN47_08955 [Danxiaibacter flavus]|uniref:Uncharacterized protein n=1 Tax=Danxiaibacter flavus TaxID=3049108 RepID=A0ABV3ZGJ8_9BACT|nr:hypothetical protein QNM32_08955 [Chitinophagaceae bacterium DXS]